LQGGQRVAHAFREPIPPTPLESATKARRVGDAMRPRAFSGSVKNAPTAPAAAEAPHSPLAFGSSDGPTDCAQVQEPPEPKRAA
jgi:hypothetical protein